MSVNVGLEGLLSAVYSQNWPANLPGRNKHNWSPEGRFEKKHERRVQIRGYDGVSREIILPSKNNERRRCWSEENGEQADGEIFDTTLDALTKAEFKRLKEQIRDVSSSMAYKTTKRSGYRTFVQKDDSAPVLYRSQLAESLRAFRLPARPPIPPEARKAEMSRCRPIIGIKPPSARLQTTPVSSQSRPYLQESNRPDSKVENPSSYDALTSDIIFNLASSQRIHSGFGDELSDDEHCSDENGPEPEVDESREIPEFPVLRPDRLEDLYMSEGERDYSKYDFDASQLEIPPYLFKYSGPDGFEKVDFEDLASFDKDWRLLTKRRPEDPEMEHLIDKFIHMERLVTKTEEWEDSKKDKCRQLARQKLIQTNLLKSQGKRIGSARRDKNCCKSCLQQMCAGDCPLKKSSVFTCHHCRQEFCSGTCIHLSYNSHSRLSSSDHSDNDHEQQPATAGNKPRPKSCQSCRRQDTNSKVINTNTIAQGRPKSSLATFSRGQSAVPAKELIYEGQECHPVIEEELKRLNIVPCSRPNTAKRSLKGREKALPGKSYFSQRHDSITVPKGERVKSAPPRLSCRKRVRSARGRKHRVCSASKPGSSHI